MYAFDFCVKLESIDLPSSLERIRHRCFNGCESLESDNLKIDCSTIQFVDDLIFGDDVSKDLIFWKNLYDHFRKRKFKNYRCEGPQYTGNGKGYCIADYLFDCRCLEKNNESSIGITISPFYFANNNIDIDDNGFYEFKRPIYKIGYGAFYNCTKLTGLKINFVNGDYIDYSGLKENAFQGCVNFNFSTIETKTDNICEVVTDSEIIVPIGDW